MNTPYTVGHDAPVTPNRDRTLEDLEGIITRGLPNITQGLLDQKQVALAMLEIHDRKLFKNGYGTFKSYLLRRWQFSRPRGYQLLHFARLTRMSTTVDAGNPQNERQARILDGNGQLRGRQEPDLTQRAMGYLGRVFEKIPRHERQEFISYIRMLLDEMEELNKSEEQADVQGCVGKNDPNSKSTHRQQRAHDWFCLAGLEPANANLNGSRVAVGLGAT